MANKLMLYYAFLSTSLLFLWGISLPLLAKDRALLIGINEYQVAKHLKATHNDVKAFRTMLMRDLGFNANAIRQLKDSQATKLGILAAIDEWLIQGTQAGDRVIFYYSGHGKQIKDLDNDEADGQDEALIPYDALANGQNWLLDDEIGERLAQLQGREILTVFDSCHSGDVTRGFFNDPDSKTPDWGRGNINSSRGELMLDTIHQQEGGFIEGGDNIIAFFAVAPNQLAYENTDSDPERPHGVFTDAFVKGVAGAADKDHNQQVSYVELLEYTRQETRWYCQNINQKCAQSGLTPVMEMDVAKQAEDIHAFGRPVLATANTTQIADAVLAHDNNAQLRLTIEPGDRIRLGETVRFKLKTQRSGKLLIFDINAVGQITQLFPNAYIPQYIPEPCQKTMATTIINAGATVLIPDNCMGFELPATEPVGKGKVVALLIEDQVIDTSQLIATINNSKNNATKSIFINIDKPDTWLAQLRAKLNQVFHDQDGHNRAIQWSITAVDYQITR